MPDPNRLLAELEVLLIRIQSCRWMFVYWELGMLLESIPLLPMCVWVSAAGGNIYPLLPMCVWVSAAAGSANIYPLLPMCVWVSAAGGSANIYPPLPTCFWIPAAGDKEVGVVRAVELVRALVVNVEVRDSGEEKLSRGLGVGVQNELLPGVGSLTPWSLVP